MPVTINRSYRIQAPTLKTYFVYMVYEKYVSWEFCVKILMEVFHKNFEQADALANEIVTNGEAICGVYIHDIAETKATIVEKLAKKENFSMRCLIEEV